MAGFGRHAFRHDSVTRACWDWNDAIQSTVPGSRGFPAVSMRRTGCRPVPWTRSPSAALVLRGPLKHCAPGRVPLAGGHHRRLPDAAMVRVSVLNDALKNMYNAEKRGKRQVLLRPSSKVVIKFLQVMQRHGKPSSRSTARLPCIALICCPPQSMPPALVQPPHVLRAGMHRVAISTRTPPRPRLPYPSPTGRFGSNALWSRMRGVEPVCVTPTGYIGEFEFVDDHRGGKIVVELNGRRAFRPEPARSPGLGGSSPHPVAIHAACASHGQPSFGSTALSSMSCLLIWVLVRREARCSQGFALLLLSCADLLHDRLNKCGVISPRYDVRHGDIETWTGKLMPSRLVRLPPWYTLLCIYPLSCADSVRRARQGLLEASVSARSSVYSS